MEGDKGKLGERIKAASDGEFGGGRKPSRNCPEARRGLSSKGKSRSSGEGEKGKLGEGIKEELNGELGVMSWRESGRSWGCDGEETVVEEQSRGGRVAIEIGINS